MADDNKPTHRLTLVSERPTNHGKEVRAVFTDICALWPTKKGDSFTGDIPAGMSLSGRILISPIDRKADDLDAESGLSDK